MEVLVFTGVLHLSRVTAGLATARRVGQFSTLQIITRTRLPVQVRLEQGVGKFLFYVNFFYINYNLFGAFLGGW
jgi:hypothetical protein